MDTVDVVDLELTKNNFGLLWLLFLKSQNKISTLKTLQYFFVIFMSYGVCCPEVRAMKRRHMTRTPVYFFILILVFLQAEVKIEC